MCIRDSIKSAPCNLHNLRKGGSLTSSIGANKNGKSGSSMSVSYTHLDVYKRQVVVKVNDRGPFHRTRAFDMTKAAFNEIGDSNSGTIPIEYEIVD